MIALLPLLLAAATAEKNAAGLEACEESQHCVMVLSGGGSRGNFQAGAAFRMIKKLRDKKRTELSIAGSSTGAINALIAGLLWCLDPAELDKQTEAHNLFFNTWMDLSLDALFPGDRTCAAYKASHPATAISCPSDSPYDDQDGIFVKAALVPIRDRLLELLDSARFAGKCRVPIALALTSERQTFVKLGAQTAPSSRRSLLFELRGHESGPLRKKISICQVREPNLMTTSQNHIEGIPSVDALLSIRLPEVRRPAGAAAAGECHEVDRNVMLDAIVASTSLPPFFAPQQLDFCADQELSCPESPRKDLVCPETRAAVAGVAPPRGRLCRERFIDGGVFDNRPVTAAREVALLGDAPPTHVAGENSPRFVVIGADSMTRFTTGDGDWQMKRGLQFYAPFLGNFLSVGRQYELQTLIRYIPDVQIDYIQSPQWLVSDYLMSYAALIDRRFAFHDYLVGLCFDAAAAAASGGRPCADLGDVPSGWLRGIGAIRAALELSHAGQPADQAGGSFAAFVGALGSEPGDCRFASSTPPIWCSNEGDFGSFQREAGDSSAEDLPYIDHLDAWTYETAQKMLARAEAIERRARNSTLATGLSLAEFYASVQAADVNPGAQFGGFTATPAAGRHSLLGAFTLVIPSSLGVESVYYGRMRFDWSLLSVRAGRLRLAAGGYLTAPQTTWPVTAGPFVEGWTRFPSMPRLGDLGARIRYDLSAKKDWPALRPELFVRPFFSRVELCLSYQIGPIEPRRPPLRFGLGLALTDLNGLVYWGIRALTGAGVGDGYGNSTGSHPAN